MPGGVLGEMEFQNLDSRKPGTRAGVETTREDVAPYVVTVEVAEAVTF